MRTTKKTTIATLAAMVSGALLLSSCGSSEAGSSEASESSPGGKTVLSVSLFGTMGFKESGLLDEYQKLNPNVEIKYESTQGESKYWPALQTKLQSGNGLADVQGIEVARIADVVANQPDKWADLGEFVTKEQIPNYLEWKAEAATTEDGKILGLGTDIGPMGMCYRSDLLQQAGLPTDPAQLASQMKSWDDYLALGRQFKAKAPAGSAWTDFGGGLYNAIISDEEEIYYDADGELVWDKNPAIKEAFDTAAKAGQEGLTAKLEQFEDPAWDPGFTSGAFATIACPSWMIGYIKGKAGEAGAGKWNVTSLPGGAGGNWGGSYLAIPEASENKEEAAKLIKWLTDGERQATVFTNVGNFPSNQQGIDLVGDATDDYFQGAPIGKIFSDSAKAAPTQILGEGDGVIKTALTNALLTVEANGVSPDDAWNNAKAEIEDTLG